MVGFHFLSDDVRIVEIQSRLFDLGAAIATPQQNSSEEKKRYVEFPPVYTAKIEEWIDDLDAQLPPLTNFVLPVKLLTAEIQHKLYNHLYYN